MTYPIFSDEYFMNEALKEAQKAFEADEVPVGAVVVTGQRIIARGCNMTEQLGDVTAHAEMIALTSAANFLGAKYLTECTLFVTLEPCLMCASALKWAQLGRLVFGASDDKAGYHIVEQPVLHPKTEIRFGVLEEECSRLMKEFFRGKR
ncbi:MAG: nucleoside deaminase [Bacteroidales bacterium]|nr:nucleoside deaminase [Bacteroidales bacterium]